MAIVASELRRLVLVRKPAVVVPNQTDANIRDSAITGSKRASDLHVKLEYLRSRHGARIATLATATRRELDHRSARDEPLPTPGRAAHCVASRTGQTVTEIVIERD